MTAGEIRWPHWVGALMLAAGLLGALALAALPSVQMPASPGNSEGGITLELAAAAPRVQPIAAAASAAVPARGSEPSIESAVLPRASADLPIHRQAPSQMGENQARRSESRATRQSEAKPQPQPQQQPKLRTLTNPPIKPVETQLPVAAPEALAAPQTAPANQDQLSAALSAASSQAPATPQPAATDAQQTALAAPAASMSASDYEASLLARIATYKRYPRRAMRRGIEGEVEVTFELDRQGRVVASQISRSSGHRILDDAVLKLLGNASPMPAPPASYQQGKLVFRVPVTFALR